MRFSLGEQLSGTPYRVVSTVGSGGMGSVFEVEHSELGKRFVLKVLHHHLASRGDLVARMRNEWRVLARLNHPNIVQVTDAGQLPSGLPFYVMEKLEGQNLSQLMGEEGRLIPVRAGGLMAQVLDALDAAHSTGTVHRDVKPQNIFIIEDDRAKLLDFGIAKLRDRAARVVTAGGVSIGTPRYMAPEQAEGRSVDGRADVYAAALVLYELILGKGPFAHIRDPNELVLAHIGTEPTRLDVLLPDLAPEWADLVQRWLAKLPKNRPASAGMAAAELRALMKGLPEASPADHDVTLGGIYGAETVGPAAVTAFDRGLRPDASSSRPGLAPRSIGNLSRTKKASEAPIVGQSGGTGAKKATLSWGTSVGELEATRTFDAPIPPSMGSHRLGDRSSRSFSSEPSRPISSSRAHPDSTRTWGRWAHDSEGASPRLMTPPPVSSTRRHPDENGPWSRLSPKQKNLATVMGALFGSFALAMVGLWAFEVMREDIADTAEAHELSAAAESAAPGDVAASPASPDERQVPQNADQDGNDPHPNGNDPHPSGNDPHPSGNDPHPSGNDPHPSGSEPKAPTTLDGTSLGASVAAMLGSRHEAPSGPSGVVAATGSAGEAETLVQGSAAGTLSAARGPSDSKADIPTKVTSSDVEKSTEPSKRTSAALPGSGLW